jgi:hypothetical protein
MTLRRAPIVVLLGLVGVGMSAASCSNGTTPVCDDAGSCLIVQPSDDSGVVADASADTATVADADAGPVIDAEAGAADGNDGSTE